MLEQMLVKYAELVIKLGVNLQKGQTLVISTPLECAPFIRTLTKAAYAAGARNVAFFWRDEQLDKIKYLYAPEDVFTEFAEWQREFYLSYAKQGAAFLSIAAEDPELLQDVDHTRIAAAQKTSSTKLSEFRDRTMNNQNAWCVISAPTEGWARKVFPDCEEPVAKLWQAILHTVRADLPDPLAAWHEHQNTLQKRLQLLNGYRLQTLHYTNSLGTDLTVALPENHLWQGATELTQEGVQFIPNMPTEEIFTLPQRTGVNGRVYSAMPLVYHGNLIDDFVLTFKDGRVWDATAQAGAKHLHNLLEVDEGARYLGEVALVPYDSPISNTNILFYNTLFDENASCHLAFGRAYPGSLADSAQLSKEELLVRGVNDSLIHVDFMIGTADLNITGTTAAGEEIAIFRQGNFAL
ncbi:MAG TPA: aminopeptidase [Oscillospiraceae bacterium]|nr:aminopeptidase [Oscillospiraceae bacterium]